VNDPDLLLCAIHVALWIWFGVTWMLFRGREAAPDGAAVEPIATTREYAAPFARLVLGFHLFGFASVYLGIAEAIFFGHVYAWLVGQRVFGAFAIAVGAALIFWTVASFSSWRIRAKLDRGHQLATNGAFRLLRHPIYTGVNIIALGSAVWVSSTLAWCAFVLVTLGSDLRARTEEALLKRAFGSRYTEYSRRTKRFIPGIY